MRKSLAEAQSASGVARLAIAGGGGQLGGLFVAAECPAHQTAVKAYPFSVQMGVSRSNLIVPADAPGPRSKVCGPLMTIRWSKFR